MPLFFQQDIDVDTKLGIWKIEESETFFLDTVPLAQSISHPHKRAQHLAGRYLLRHLFPPFPLSLIEIADTRKPFLKDEAYHFSISHCGDYAAAIVSKKWRVGIDIEQESIKIKRVQHKFMSLPETALLVPPVMVWSCKEALFKWYGKGGLDFKQHLHITGAVAMDGLYEIDAVFSKGRPQPLHLTARFFGPLCLSYIITAV